MSAGAVDAFAGPKAPKLPKSAEEKHTGRRVIVVLEKAALETVKTKRGFELLNADEHKGILLKHKKEPSEYRPDIVHQVRDALYLWMDAFARDLHLSSAVVILRRLC
jgi:rRNA small subunit pseudouridine methyltransferase Nep1